VAEFSSIWAFQLQNVQLQGRWDLFRGLGADSWLRPGPASYLVLRNSPIWNLGGPANSGSSFPRVARSWAEGLRMTIPSKKVKLGLDSNLRADVHSPSTAAPAKRTQGHRARAGETAPQSNHCFRLAPEHTSLDSQPAH